MAYESPIKINYQEGIPAFRTFHEEIGEKIDCRIMASIKDRMEIEIDKGELIRALSYDRDQYGKGYDEGYSQGMKDATAYNREHPEMSSPAEWLETDHKGTPYLCPSCQCFSNLRYYWCPWCGKDMRPCTIREAEENPDEL